MSWLLLPGSVVGLDRSLVLGTYDEWAEVELGEMVASWAPVTTRGTPRHRSSDLRVEAHNPRQLDLLWAPERGQSLLLQEIAFVHPHFTPHWSRAAQDAGCVLLGACDDLDLGDPHASAYDWLETLRLTEVTYRASVMATAA